MPEDAASRTSGSGFSRHSSSAQSELRAKNVFTPAAAPQYRLFLASSPFPKRAGTGTMPWCWLSLGRKDRRALQVNSNATKIVIAEDDPSSRELLTELLESWGYDVIEARNGADALQKILARPPDLVVCDIKMPVLDGVGLVQALRRDNNLASIPVIALTGFDPQDHEEIASAGFNTYQSKPVSTALLKKNVERLLQKGTKDRTAK